MNWDQIKGKWKQIKGDVQSEWGELTNDEVDRAEGDREKLEGIIQAKYGKSKEEVRNEVDNWMKKVA
ncbi:CsbD family protein [Cognatishimia sp. MH4019]|uniref:CsbD family protein n=1 Tax=Cognatishimia sp. MH4019 TaxID=2854030 RepID=UPI001CD44E85|nr:CsbD family protein [Cognatishimia sp. MH4019]